MDGVCSGHLAAVLRWLGLRFRKHIADVENSAGHQPKADKRAGCRQGPRGLDRLFRRRSVSGCAYLGSHFCWSAAAPPRLWLHLAYRRIQDRTFPVLDDMPVDICRNKWRDVFQHSIASVMRADVSVGEGSRGGNSQGILRTQRSHLYTDLHGNICTKQVRIHLHGGRGPVHAYLLAVMIVQDQLSLSRMMELLLTALLLFILLSPLAMPIASALTATRDQPINVPLLENEKKQENEEQRSDVERQDRAETNLSDETGKTEDLTTGEKGKRSGCMGRLRVRWFTVAATETDAVNFKRKRSGPHRGENFTLLQALRKADFWLLFFALVCGGGAGLTIIDNMGQIAESRGSSSHMFVSMISIWNFLGRVAGGFLSEIVAR
eukprot:TRINITY_DN370_c0_g1_i3.p1 TRINITY_DN370_c0_g1~~TRINITY_DN370_c0_g1_i3.p1  ORF type:complete len:378 (-),score=-0.22 TRINITY_DN370_c0_g1_i3:1211-2344(-)